MTTRLYRWLATIALLLFAAGAHAATTCSVYSPGFVTAYDPAAGGNTVVQTNFTIDCTRASGDPASFAYTVSADNGLYKRGKNTNQAAYTSGATTSYIQYDTFQNSNCTTQFKGGGASDYNGTFTFAAGALAQTFQQTFWGCVFPGQTTLPAGTYSDTPTLTLTYGAKVATGSFGVQIATPSTCALTAPPSAVAFGAYVAFGGALAASAGFGATCTNFLPYTMTVTPTSGTIAGVSYTLLLQSASPVMSGTSLNATGSGVQQTYTIKGSMAAGQPGTCSAGTCPGSVPHVLTLSY